MSEEIMIMVFYVCVAYVSIKNYVLCGGLLIELVVKSEHKLAYSFSLSSLSNYSSGYREPDHPT
ncbi:hypothetical protein J6590_063740 [Homalodisca vitripennis]|nr:hypothetical protein J6590_063740 [Homalodisca vitripennis]